MTRLTVTLDVSLSDENGAPYTGKDADRIAVRWAKSLLQDYDRFGETGIKDTQAKTAKVTARVVANKVSRDTRKRSAEHRAADLAAGRDWLTEGCMCGACRQVRAVKE